MTERRVAIVLRFASDDELAAWQRAEWADPHFTTIAVRDALDRALPEVPHVVEDELVALVPHPYSPYINPPTARSMRLHGPERLSERAMRLAATARERERGESQ